MSRRRQSNRRSRPQSKRHYPRTARVNSLLQQIVADYFNQLDDERIDFLTITGVEVDNDFNKAQVYFSSLDSEYQGDELVEFLGEYRIQVQSAIAAQARIRKTPEVVFRVDPAIEEGNRIENILKNLGSGEEESSDSSSHSDRETE